MLSSVDDVQLMLDDHILKSQTMRGSPFVKPFEAEMQAWEEKLISMQDILDQWIQVEHYYAILCYFLPQALAALSYFYHGLLLP